jgi:hypothetical protein
MVSIDEQHNGYFYFRQDNAEQNRRGGVADVARTQRPGPGPSIPRRIEAKKRAKRPSAVAISIAFRRKSTRSAARWRGSSIQATGARNTSFAPTFDPVPLSIRQTDA